MMSAADFHSAVVMFCARLNGSVTSYGRTPLHNASVGGVRQSAHQYWLAADVVYDVPVTRELAVDTASRLDLKLVREADHDHLQPIDWEAG